MWIFTTIGFFSVVQKPGDDQLTVRARFDGDLDRLRDRFLPELGPAKRTPDADYLYRARVEQAAFAQAMAKIAADIDYSNFKSAVGARQGHDRAHVYADVWSVLYGAQERSTR